MKIVLLGTTAACVLGFRANLIQALVKTGDCVYAFALDFDEDSREKVRALGAIPVDYTFSRASSNPITDLVNTYRLMKQFRTINPDLVFSYFSKPVVFGTLAAVFAGVKRRIGMLEGLGYSFTVGPKGLSTKQKILQLTQVFLYKISFPFLERLIFLNPDDPQDLLEKKRIKVKEYSVLGGIGLDLSSYPYVEPRIKDISFIFVGRLLAEKGIHEYIAAAKVVKKNYPTVRFVVLGGLDDGNPGALSKAQLNTLIAEGVVEYPGHVDNVKDWLIRASVFVLPSYREGVPRSTQEAMAVGRPVITTDLPGCRETVIDGVNGFLIKPWSVNELVEKMERFIEQPELVFEMGRQSFQLAQEKFDVNKVNKVLVGYLHGVDSSDE